MSSARRSGSDGSFRRGAKGAGQIKGACIVTCCLAGSSLAWLLVIEAVARDMSISADAVHLQGGRTQLGDVSHFEDLKRPIHLVMLT